MHTKVFNVLNLTVELRESKQYQTGSVITCLVIVEVIMDMGFDALLAGFQNFF